MCETELFFHRCRLYTDFDYIPRFPDPISEDIHRYRSIYKFYSISINILVLFTIMIIDKNKYDYDYCDLYPGYPKLSNKNKTQAPSTNGSQRSTNVAKSGLTLSWQSFLALSCDFRIKSNFHLPRVQQVRVKLIVDFHTDIDFKLGKLRVGGRGMFSDRGDSG